jgi:hypothetical protein
MELLDVSWWLAPVMFQVFSLHLVDFNGGQGMVADIMLADEILT